jgi:hypothetical protein
MSIIFSLTEICHFKNVYVLHVCHLYVVHEKHFKYLHCLTMQVIANFINICFPLIQINLYSEEWIAHSNFTPANLVKRLGHSIVSKIIMLETFTECKVCKHFTSHKLSLLLISHIITDM